MSVLSKCLSKCFECGQKSSISLLSSFMDLPNETLAHIFEVFKIAQLSYMYINSKRHALKRYSKDKG